MALEVGDIQCTSGLAKAIFDQMKAVKMPRFARYSPDQRELILSALREDAYVIAAAIVPYLKSNAEVIGVTTQGTGTTAQGVALTCQSTQNNQGKVR